MSLGFSDFMVALGLAIVLEGIAYALFPDGMKKMLLQVLAQPPSHLRITGLLMAAGGVCIVWLIRG